LLEKSTPLPTLLSLPPGSRLALAGTLLKDLVITRSHWQVMTCQCDGDYTVVTTVVVSNWMFHDIAREPTKGSYFALQSMRECCIVTAVVTHVAPHGPCAGASLVCEEAAARPHEHHV
jgi:hypothetical protein